MCTFFLVVAFRDARFFIGPVWQVFLHRVCELLTIVSEDLASHTTAACELSSTASNSMAVMRCTLAASSKSVLSLVSSQHALLLRHPDPGGPACQSAQAVRHPATYKLYKRLASGALASPSMHEDIMVRICSQSASSSALTRLRNELSSSKSRLLSVCSGLAM